MGDSASYAYTVTAGCEASISVHHAGGGSSLGGSGGGGGGSSVLGSIDVRVISRSIW